MPSNFHNVPLCFYYTALLRIFQIEFTFKGIQIDYKRVYFNARKPLSRDLYNFLDLVRASHCKSTAMRTATLYSVVLKNNQHGALKMRGSLREIAVVKGDGPSIRIAQVSISLVSTLSPLRLISQFLRLFTINWMEKKSLISWFALRATH